MKLSQSALAEKTGLTRNCIQQMECYEPLPRFWEELEEAYQRDRVLQEAEAETPQKV